MTSCEHWDCGFCYAPYYLKTSAINGACNNPYKCPTFRESEPVQYETPMTENEEEIEKVKAQIKVLEKKIALLEEIEKKKQSQTLTDLLFDWWADVFTTGSDWDSETCIADLVNQIEAWLPEEHDTNSYKWNQCIRTIKEKLR